MQFLDDSSKNPTKPPPPYLVKNERSHDYSKQINNMKVVLLNSVNFRSLYITIVHRSYALRLALSFVYLRNNFSKWLTKELANPDSLLNVSNPEDGGSNSRSFTGAF